MKNSDKPSAISITGKRNRRKRYGSVRHVEVAASLLPSL